MSDIIKMAKDAGLLADEQPGDIWAAWLPAGDYLGRLQRFADLIRADAQVTALEALRAARPGGGHD